MTPRRLQGLFLFLACAQAATAIIVDPDIYQYGVGKTRGYVQSGPTTVTADSFTFNAFVDKRTGGQINAAKILGPLNSYLDVNGPQNLTLNSNGAEFHSTAYLSQGSLDGNFPNDNSGNYVLKVDTGLVSGLFDYSVTFQLGGDAYVPDVPLLTINNGGWSNGSYTLNANNPTAFGWSFSNYNSATDVVLFNIKTSGGVSVVDEQFKGSNPGGFTVSGLTVGTSYTGRLTYARIVDNPTTISGADGFAYYAMETTFNFTAVPEPSTYVLLLTGLGCVWLGWRRRRVRTIG